MNEIPHKDWHRIDSIQREILLLLGHDNEACAEGEDGCGICDKMQGLCTAVYLMGAQAHAEIMHREMRESADESESTIKRLLAKPVAQTTHDG